MPGVNRRHEPPPLDPVAAGVPFPYDLHDFFAARRNDGVHLFKQCHSNSLMASDAGHPFWRTVFAAWAAAAAAQGATQQIGHVSGIYMLRTACEAAAAVAADAPPLLLLPNGPGGRPATLGLRAPTKSADAAAARAARAAWRAVLGGGQRAAGSSSALKPVGTPELLWCMVHHQTNSWRWKARRDDALRLVDFSLKAGLAAAAACAALAPALAGTAAWSFRRWRGRRPRAHGAVI